MKHLLGLNFDPEERSSREKTKGKQKFFPQEVTDFFVPVNSRHDLPTLEDHRLVFRTATRQGKSNSRLNSYTRILFLKILLTKIIK